MSKYIKLEDAIHTIEDKIAEYIPYLYGRYYEMPLEIRMAIEHLPTIEVSEDCISRAEALKAYNEAVDELVKAEMKEFNLGDFTECSFNTTQLKLIARKIEDAPSVVPSRAEGEWISQEQGAFYPVECSNCHKQPLLNEDEDYEYTKYCPYCGAKMKVNESIVSIIHA